MSRSTDIPLDEAWELADLVGETYSRVLARAEGTLENEELSVGEFVALVVLCNFPEGLTQTDWGMHQGVSRQRAHTVARKLEALGLITVTRQGRASTIVLAPKGDELVRTLKPRSSRALVEEFGGLDREEVRELTRLLQKMLGHHER